MEKGKIQINSATGREYIEKEVKEFGTNSAHVIVPSSWVGCNVKVVV